VVGISAFSTRGFLAFSALALPSWVACGSPASVDPLEPPFGVPADARQGTFQSGTSADGSCPEAWIDGIDECPRSERALADGDAAALGFEPDELLAVIAGEHRAPLTWRGYGVPTGASTELALTIEPSGDARFVDQTVSGSQHEITFGNTGGRYLRCGNRLAVDARLRIATADGALNEVVDATVEADSGRYARVVVTLPADEVAGSLAASVQAPKQDRRQISPTELTLVFGVSEFGLEARLGAHAEFDGASGDEVGEPCNTLGESWLAQSCPWGSLPLRADEELVGLSFAGALAQLNASSPTTLNDTGARLELRADAEFPDSLCISVDTPATLPQVLPFPGRVWLESSDGRVGGSVEAQLQEEALGGAFHRVTAYMSFLVPVSDGLSELAPSYGILAPLVWSEQEHGGFEFFAEATEQSSGGILRAIGAKLGCEGSRPCEEVCPGPGCTATNAEKWGVRWGELSDAAALSIDAL
jgi:hypothetical protein